MKKIMYLALVASSLPMAAMAGGMAQPVVEPVVQMPPPVLVAPSTDWTGLYAGASLGFGSVTASGGKSDARGGFAGVDLGYRKDFGTVVVGGEISYAKNDIGLDSTTDQINHTLAGELMLGADLGRTLVYVSGGVARANATLGGSTTTDTGYFAGIGADYLVNDKWTVGAELKSSVYNDFSNSGVDLKDTAVGLKVGMRF